MLKVFLSSGYKRDEWSFDLALSAAESKSNGPSDVLYRLIAASILDENKMGELNANPQWQAIPSSALEPQRLVDRGVQ